MSRLHRNNYFLVFQHPSGPLTFSAFAGGRAIGRLLWRHGIHEFMEGLRRRLPASRDYMLTFLAIANQMIGLLDPTSDLVWLEVLGDLARYGIATANDVQQRETCTRRARFWYCKMADISPQIGRLFHHLAVLARPRSLQHLSECGRSLACAESYIKARSKKMRR